MCTKEFEFENLQITNSFETLTIKGIKDEHAKSFIPFILADDLKTLYISSLRNF
jgi:hypothetical protein